MIKIVCLGAGRLADQLMPQLESTGCEVVQVYSRTAENAISLSGKLKAAQAITNIVEIRPDADMYILAVADDAIAPVAKQIAHLENDQCIFVHCSGIHGLDILPFHRSGIFYPLQSFSPQHPVHWDSVPLLLTADNPEVRALLERLAKKLSSSVHHVSDAQKSLLHVAAVFANNFTNHMLTVAESLCVRNGLSFDLLKPLVRETLEKALMEGPSRSQTGPAVRGDTKTIAKHLNLLSEDEVLQDIYRLMTKRIMETMGSKTTPSQDRN